jgi:hypothetical protein
MEIRIRIFKYIDQLDCFIVTPAYKDISRQLGLTEWNEVNWIGRYFLLDNDFGEHWFDNWDLRDSIEKKASEMGIAHDDILIIDSERFKNEKDGPCHSTEQRKLFWTDVLKSLELSLELIFNEAKEFNEKREKGDSDYINDLEERMNKIKSNLINK